MPLSCTLPKKKMSRLPAALPPSLPSPTAASALWCSSNKALQATAFWGMWLCNGLCRWRGGWLCDGQRGRQWSCHPRLCFDQPHSRSSRAVIVLCKQPGRKKKKRRRGASSLSGTTAPHASSGSMGRGEGGGTLLSLLSRIGEDVGEWGGRGDNDDNCKRGSWVVVIVKWGDGEGGGTLLSSSLLSSRYGNNVGERGGGGQQWWLQEGRARCCHRLRAAWAKTWGKGWQGDDVNDDGRRGNHVLSFDSSVLTCG